jgi:hypothetical protein
MNLKLEAIVIPVSDVLRTFTDPDGNGWLIQEIKKQAPGR